jgi:pyridoxamine 5'-phosphate oxidase
MPLKKQVRVEGIVSLVSDEEADNYFASRPRESRIGSWASKQSQVMEQESDLLERYSFYEQKFFNQSVPRPPFWSGYRITPTYLEFWQEGSHRLHHRICYRKMDNLWEIKQLYP